jgi:4-amino-4-deoxy-L-arabinose transferase-like glycosyltransferase
LGTLYSVVTPLFETPDEVWHYLYVKHIADGGGLPVYSEGMTFPMRQEASQPPLYYLLNGWATGWIDTSDVATVVQYNPHAAIGAPSEWGNRNVVTHTSYEAFPYRGTVLAAHLSRFLSVLMGAATVLCTYATARRLFPRPDWLAPAAAALNAFLPQFIFISASINNDVLATLLSALSLWLLVCIAQDGPSAERLEHERKATARLLALGAVLGLAALTKLNALVLMPLAAVVLIALAWTRRQRRALFRWGAWTSAAAALVGGWWYVRNWLLYGDPFGLQLMFAVLEPHAQRPTGARLLHLLDGALKSFFGVFGWFNIVMEPWTYVIFELGLIVAVLGLARFLYHRAVRQRRAEWLRVGLLALWSMAFVAALVGWTQARFPQGRLLFPAMPAIATLLVLGLAQWIPARYTRLVITVLLVVLLGFATVVPYRYIAPAYATSQPLTAAEREAIAHPAPAELGERVRLLGYDVSDETVTPGTRLWVELYWQGLAAMNQDYSVFVHLLDDRGVTVVQRDSYPGAGNNPTRDWKVGESIRDVYPLDVPAALLAQAPLRIRVGFYDYATGQRLPVERPGGPAADSLELPLQLGLERPPSAALHELSYEFGRSIALTGFSVQPLVARPGDTLRVILRWQALKTLDENDTVFVQLIRTGAQIWAQNDHVPVDGQAPTSTWTAGQVVMDEFDLRIYPDAPEDIYELIVGLYESATIERLSLPTGADSIVLGKIAVRSE